MPVTRSDGTLSTRDDWDRHWSAYNQANERNPAQAFRRRLILEVLARAGGVSRLVDIGSGQGQLAVDVQKIYPQASILGLEYSESGVAIASRKVPGANFIQRDLLKEDGVPEAYQRWGRQAVCSEVLEHVDEPVTLLRNARAYLAPGCSVLVTVPGGPMSAFDRHIGHRTHFSPASLGSVLTEAGYEVDSCFGAGFPTFNLYRLLVIRRGERLVDEVSSEGGVSFVAQAAMAAFDPLLRFTLMRSRWGWQTVGVARVPDA